MLQQSWKKVYSRTTTKSNPLLQPEHGFCQQNGPERGKLQDWYPDEESGGPHMLEWWMLFFRVRGYCIVLTKTKAMSL